MAATSRSIFSPSLFWTSTPSNSAGSPALAQDAALAKMTLVPTTSARARETRELIVRCSTGRVALWEGTFSMGFPWGYSFSGAGGGGAAASSGWTQPAGGAAAAKRLGSFSTSSLAVMMGMR